MQVMLEHNAGESLTGRIEMDDAYLGGERPGKRGRGADHKFPFVAAVQTSTKGHPLQIQLRRVPTFSSSALKAYANRSVRPGSHVVSDGLACFNVFDRQPRTHEKIITGGGRNSTQIPAFKWVNTILGKVKNAITAVFHWISEAHAPRYLAEFEYRFNRRFVLGSMIERFAYVALRTPPMPYRLLRMAEQYA